MASLTSFAQHAATLRYVVFRPVPNVWKQLWTKVSAWNFALIDLGAQRRPIAGSPQGVGRGVTQLQHYVPLSGVGQH